MRPEEERVAQCMTDRITGFSGVTPCEDDPPDFWASMDGNPIAVEVTRLMPRSVAEDGSVENRTDSDVYLSRLSDRLNEEFKARVPENIALFLVLWGPVSTPRKFENGLRSVIEGVITTVGIAPGWSRKFDIEGIKVEIVACETFPPPGRRIVSMVGNSNAVLWVVGEATLILGECLAAKTKAVDRIRAEKDWDGPIWLALINNHPFTTIAEFSEAYGRLSFSHPFERVVIIERDGGVHFLK